MDAWVRILPSSVALQMASPGRGLRLQGGPRRHWVVVTLGVLGPRGWDIRIGERVGDLEGDSRSDGTVGGGELGRRKWVGWLLEGVPGACYRGTRPGYGYGA